MVFVIALGKKTEVIFLLFVARGLQRDQHDILMIKLDFILRRQRAAGGCRNETILPSILSENQDAAFISSHSHISSETWFTTSFLKSPTYVIYRG